MKNKTFANRKEAGKILASRLSGYAKQKDLLVLALPRGGIPVAFEISQALKAPLNVFLVRKLGVPGQDELAMGAIAEGEIIVRNEDVIGHLKIPDSLFNAAVMQEARELAKRESLYHLACPRSEIVGKNVILVDDGIATGSSMHAAVDAIRQQKPLRIVIAVPVAAASTADELKQKVDEFVCIHTPYDFSHVGAWYENFAQVTDQEAHHLLSRARSGLVHF